MNSSGEKIRQLREAKGLPLRSVAAFLDLDQAILSKVERGQRKISRQHIIQLAQYFEVPSDELLVPWLTDKVLYQLGDDALSAKALQLAEEQVAYRAFAKTDRKGLLQTIKAGIKKFTAIEKAWIYGSFARGDDGPKSDIDIALQTNNTFNYFDLAEVQHELEKIIDRKIDLGFIDAFKPYVYENVKSDLQLIYEK